MIYKKGLWLLALSCSAMVTGVSTFGKEKPNILYILTDDQRYDSIKVFNKILHNRDKSALGYVESPNVDRLADQGTTFINTYVHSQACAPSRAAMHTGRYPHHSGVFAFEYHNNKAPHWKPNLPETLITMGYQTMHSGKLGIYTKTIGSNGKAKKYNLGYQTDISTRDVWASRLTDWRKERVKKYDGVAFTGKKPAAVEVLTSPDGTEDYLCANLNSIKGKEDHNAKVVKKYEILHMPDKGSKQIAGVGSIIGGESPQPAGKLRDDTYTQGLVNYLNSPNQKFNLGSIKRNGPDPSKPLFAHIGYSFPHTPVLPPKSYRDRFKTYKYKIPKFDKSELKKLPKQLSGLIKSKMTDHFTDAQKLQMVQDYYAFCAYGDTLVGQSFDAFVEYSEKNNQPWMVIYVCGDHGWKLNEHGSTSKFSPWKIDSLNPIIVISSDKKKFPAGKVIHDFTEFVDIMPTSLAAAGADLKDKTFDHLDGYDLAKVASGELDAREYVIGESHHVTGPRATIRTKNFMFSMKIKKDKKFGNMDWAPKSSYKDVEPVLYYLKKDPNEKNNIAFEKEYEKVATFLRKKLQDIVLGDGRIECNWTKKANGKEIQTSNFALGSDDKKLDFNGKL